MKKVIDLAIEGERWAVEFIADRLDGKPRQAVHIEGEDAVDSMSREDAVAKILELQKLVPGAPRRRDSRLS